MRNCSFYSRRRDHSRQIFYHIFFSVRMLNFRKKFSQNDLTFSLFTGIMKPIMKQAVTNSSRQCSVSREKPVGARLSEELPNPVLSHGGGAFLQNPIGCAR